ncbi:MAG: TorF family putative porin [Bacteroidota bacterium]
MKLINNFVVIGLFTFTLFFSSIVIKAQDNEEATGLEFTYGADLVSRYVWRGGELAGKNNPQFQPAVNLTYSTENAGSFSFGIWSSFGLKKNYIETDFTLSYNISTDFGEFGIALTDYYFPYLKNKFFNYKDDGEGSHIIEGALSYVPVQEYPIKLLLANNLLNDLPNDNSLYIEASYPFELLTLSFNAFVGTAKGRSFYYGVNTDKFELTNAGISVSRAVNFTEDFALQFGLDEIYNQHLKKNYIVFKISYYN